MEATGEPDDLLAAALASGKTWKQAAEATGFSQSTIARRVKEPEFRQKVRDFRREMVDEALGKASAALVDSITILHEISIASPMDAVRVSAAKACIDAQDKLRRHVELEERIAKLEERHRESGEPVGDIGETAA
jgi:hypothetical protein